MSIHELRPVAHGSETAEASPLRERVLSLRLPQQQSKSRSSGSGKAAWVVVVLLLAVVGVLIYLLMQKQRVESASPTAPAKSAGEMPTASSGDIALDSKGYIMPVQRILVSPKVSGMIVKLDILEGRHVKKGDVLAELRGHELQV